MSEPFARWPEEVGFVPGELVVILSALDLGVERSTDAAAFRVFRRAQLVIWRKLWPELAEHYDDQDLGEEE